MGFGNKKGKSSFGGGKKGKKPSKFKNIGAVWESEEYGNTSISFDDYHGDLVFVEKETGTAYKVKYLSMFEPKPGRNGKRPPKNMLYNLAINMEKVEEMDG